MKKLCVFCGSSAGRTPDYLDFSKELGINLVKNQMGLVYGGASIGVMGAIADQVLESQGEAIGVIPKSLLEWEVAHEGLSQLHVVDTMHARKELMYELSDAFVALPGGFGTLDELCEILTWAQLKYHQKPIYLLNYRGFFDHLLKHFEHTRDEGFVSKEHFSLLQVVSTVDELFEKLA